MLVCFARTGGMPAAAATARNTCLGWNWWCCSFGGRWLTGQSRRSLDHTFHAAGSPSHHPTSEPPTCHVVHVKLDSPAPCFFSCDTPARRLLTMALFLIMLSLLAVVVLSFVLLPRSLRFVGELLGSNLRRASRTRRELLLARVASEQRTYDAEHKGQKEKEKEEDWEEVEASMVGSAVNGGKADKDWSGIVGFFHPFW